MRKLATTVPLFLLMATAACASPSVLGDPISSAGTPPPSPTSSPGSQTIGGGGEFLPGQIIAFIPVYPGAVGATDIGPQPEAGPYPESLPMCVGPHPECPQLETATADFFTEDSAGTVLDWYRKQLASMGYTGGGTGTASNNKTGWTMSDTVFDVPEYPGLKVQVNVYPYPEPGVTTAFAILVYYLRPIPRHAAERLPSDIMRVEVTSDSASSTPTTSNTVTNTDTIKRLVDLVNSLPVQLTGVTSCPPFPAGATPTPPLILQFVDEHGLSRTITLRKWCGGAFVEVAFPPYPALSDQHQKLWDLVQGILAGTAPSGG